MARGKGNRKAKTEAQRQKIYMDKQKTENPEEMQQKNIEKQKKHQQEKSEEKKTLRKIQNREQKKAKREEKKAEEHGKLLKEKHKKGASAYQTNAAYGKAKARAAKGLPEDQERAMEVVMGLKRTLEKRMGPREEVREEEADKGIKHTTRNLAMEFFYRQVFTIIILFTWPSISLLVSLHHLVMTSNYNHFHYCNAGHLL